MKLFMAVLLLSAQVFAAESQSLQKIDDPMLQLQYKDAVLAAIAGKKMINCRDMAGKGYEANGGNWDLSSYTGVVLNRSAQPVLIFSRNDNYRNVSLSFSTSPDFKTLTAFVYRAFQYRRVNVGTIVDPSFVEQQVMTTQNACDIQ